MGFIIDTVQRYRNCFSCFCLKHLPRPLASEGFSYIRCLVTISGKKSWGKGSQPSFSRHLVKLKAQLLFSWALNLMANIINKILDHINTSIITGPPYTGNHWLCTSNKVLKIYLHELKLLSFKNNNHYNEHRNINIGRSNTATSNAEFFLTFSTSYRLRPNNKMKQLTTKQLSSSKK